MEHLTVKKSRLNKEIDRHFDSIKVKQGISPEDSVARLLRGRRNLSVARPVRPRSVSLTLSREALSYAARASASLSFAPIGCERFYGSFRPGKNNVFEHTSILVQPRQNL